MAKKKRKSKSQRAKQQQQARAAARQQAEQTPAVPDASTLPPEKLTKPDKTSGDFRRRVRKEKAAQLIAKGNLTIEEVAESIGVTRETIYQWNREPEFTARIAQLQQRIKDKLETLLISQKFYRQLTLQEQLLSLQQIKDARAAKLNVPAEEGGESGLMVRRLRMIGSGENATTVEEFVVDTAFAKEVRETLKQAAQEAGQWVEKVAPTTPDGQDEYSGIPAPELSEFRQLSVEDRIRLLRAPLRVPPTHRAESPPEV